MSGRLIVLAALCACRADVANVDGAFYAWDDRPVHCAIEIDTASGNHLSSIEHGLDRARQRGEVLELLVHQPGTTLDWGGFEAVLAAAHDRGLPFLTYRDLVNPDAATAGVALQYDDWWVPTWMASRALLAKYGAKVTIFVAHYADLGPEQRAEIRMLADDGDAIEAHGVRHLRGPNYVQAHGLDAYLTDEILPSIDRLRADGYPVEAFAYPFGMRTDETDHAILDRGAVQAVRSLTRSSLHGNACPE